MKPFRHPNRTTPHERVREGPSFILPPHDRLFCAFDRRSDALAATIGLLDEDEVAFDVWVFEGEPGAEHLDPMLVRHGPRVVLGRLAQRLLTGDAEYNNDLVAEIRRGGVVLAIHVDRDHVSNVLPLLVRHGGHTMSFGTHWNYVGVSTTSKAA